MTTPAAEPKDLASHVAARFLLQLTAVSFPTGALIAAYYQIWAPMPRRASRVVGIAQNIGLAAAFGLLFSAAMWLWLRSILRNVLKWDVEARRPQPAEQRNLLAVPRRIARFMFGQVVLMAVVIAAINYANNGLVAEAARTFIGVLLTGLTFAALAYLVAEHSLREVFARAGPSSDTAIGTAVGVRARLLLAWALGSAIPLVFILAIPIARTEPGRVALSAAWPTSFMACIGLLIGVTTTWTVARSISDPLAKVRAGLRRVTDGDLDYEVPVDDPGEVGLLQAGFNDMVAGLRERRVLEDLFGRHVGEEVARRAMTQGVSLGGEVREASVLMVDLVGSTSLARRLPPEQVVALLNTFFAAVVEAVTEEGGWVNKFEGDAALCIFGVPDHLDDHAGRALRAARKLRSRLVELFATAPELDAGTGLSAGRVVAGNVGAARRFEYTVIGDPVNEAARLADLAKTLPGRTAASGSIIQLSRDGEASWRRDQRVILRGRDIETDVFLPQSR